MWEFIRTAYCVTVPFLLILSLFRRKSLNLFFMNLLAVSNLVLIIYSLYLGRQLMILYQMAGEYKMDTTGLSQPGWYSLIRILLIVILPLLFLIKTVRESRWFTLAVLLLIYTVFAPSTWNLFDMVPKVIVYFCLICSAYALFWLRNQLPHQSRPS